MTAQTRESNAIGLNQSLDPLTASSQDLTSANRSKGVESMLFFLLARQAGISADESSWYQYFCECYSEVLNASPFRKNPLKALLGRLAWKKFRRHLIHFLQMKYAEGRMKHCFQLCDRAKLATLTTLEIPEYLSELEIADYKRYTDGLTEIERRDFARECFFQCRSHWIATQVRNTATHLFFWGWLFLVSLVAYLVWRHDADSSLWQTIQNWAKFLHSII